MIRRLKRQTKRRHSVRADWSAVERRAKQARRDAAIAKVLREGGIIVCGTRAYDRLIELAAQTGLALGFWGVEIRRSAFLEPDDVYAMARPRFELLQRPVLDYERSPFYVRPSLV